LFVKLPACQGIANLAEILYVESERVAATIYRRRAERWTATALAAADRLHLDSSALDIPFMTFYRAIPALSR
jgi:hypothetical protein